MNRRRRILVACLAAPPLLAGLIAAGLLAWLASPGAGRFLGGRLAAAAAARGVDLRLSGLRLHPLRLAAEVDRVRLEVPGEPGFLLEASGAWVGLDGRSLLAGKVRPRVILADTLDLAVRTRAGGRGTGEGHRGTGIDSRLLACLARVSVRRGRVRWRDRSLPFALDARGIRAPVPAEASPGRAAGTLSAGPVWIRAGAGRAARELVLDRFATRWALAPGGELLLRDLVLEGRGADFDGWLRLADGGDRLVVEGRGRARLDLERWFPVPARGAVAVAVGLRARWPGDWSVTGRLLAAEGSAAPRVAGRPVRGLGGVFRVSPEGFHLGNLRGSVAGLGEVEEFELSRDPAGGWSGGGRVVVELAGPASGAVPPWLPVAGRVRADVRLAGRTLRVAANLEAARALLPLAGRVSGTLGPAGGRLAFTGRWGDGPLEGALEIRGAPSPDVEWELRLGRAFLSRREIRTLLDLAGREGWLPRGLTGSLAASRAGVSGTMRGRGRVPGEMRLRMEVRRPRIGRSRWHLLEAVCEVRGPGRWRVDGRLADAWGDGIVGDAEKRPGRPVRVRLAGRRVPSSLAAALVPGLARGAEPAGPWLADGALDLALDPFDASGTAVLSVEGIGSGAPRFRGTIVRRPDGRGRAVLSGEAEGLSVGAVVDLGEGASPAGPDPAGMVRAVPRLRVEARSGRFALFPLPVDLRGRLRLDLAALREPGGGWTAAGGVRWEGLAVAGRRFPDGAAGLAAIPGGFAGETTVAGLRARVEVSGVPASPVLHLRVEGKDVAVLRRLASLGIASPPPWLSARADGTLDLEGPLFRPASWRGRVSSLRVRVIGPGWELRSSRPGTVRVEGGRARLAGPWSLAGDEGTALEVAGELDWEDAVPGLDLALRGTVPLRLVEGLDPDLLASGTVAVDLHARGPLARPRLSGRLALREGRVRHLPSGVAVDRGELTLEIEGGTARVVRGSGFVGGGEVIVRGTVALEGWRPGTLDLAIAARDVALAIPDDFVGRYDADLAVGGTVADPEVRGTVELLAGRYGGPLEFLSATRRRRRAAPGVGQEGWLARIGLDVRLVADESLAVRDEVAELFASSRLRVTGTLAAPEFAGTVTLLEGGRFSLRGLDYRILSGQVMLDDPRGQPVRLVARGETRVRGYRVLFDLDASESSLDYHLSSIPALPRQEILLLLLTGSTGADLDGSGAEQAREAAGTLFGSRLGELLVGGPARKYLGITRFQVAPSRVGPEARPTARVTLGKRVDERTMVIFSRDLSAEGNDLYRVDRDLSPTLQASVVREPLGGVGFDLRWLRRLAAGARERDRGSRRLRRARFTGWPAGLRRPRLRQLGILRQVPDSRALHIRFRDAVRRALILGGYFASRVTVRSVPVGRRGFSLVADVAPGPRYRLEVSAPPRIARLVREELADLWATTEFRPALLREAERVVLRALARHGHAAATVDLRFVPGAAPALLARVDPGPVVRVARVRYEGARDIPASELKRQVLSRPGGLLAGRPILDPQQLRDDAHAIEALCASRGYLAARVEPRFRLAVDGRTATVVFRVDEGPLVRIGAVRVSGDWPTDVLGPATAHLRLATGDPFEQERVLRARRALARALDDNGWYEARVETRSTLRGETVDLEFRVRPGPRAVVAEIAVEGIRRTRRRLVLRSVPFRVGRPLRSVDLREAERNLFRLGLFREVRITARPLPGAPGRRRVVIHLAESPPRTVFLQAGYDTEERGRAAVGFSAENVGGMGRTASLWLFGSSLRSVARATFEDRHLEGGRREGLVALDRTREERDGFTLQGWSATIQLGSHPEERRRWQVRWVLERTRFLDVTLDPAAIAEILREEGRRIDAVRLGGLVLDVARDRRDDPFLPGSGSLWRGEIGLWTGWLGSEADFARGKVQWVRYRGRGRLVGVVSVRLGAAVPFGGTGRVPLSRRFFLGGADTVRGFPRDMVGPRDRPGGHPVGGEAMGIVNLEARWRVGEHLELVAFHDLGNGWRTAGDLGAGFRRTVGLGLRLRTPVGPVRLEYGHVLDREEGESPGRFYFSIGEPF